MLNYLIRQSKITDVDDENLQNNPFKSLMTDKTAKRLQATFRALDTDNSGLISAQNLADALTSSKQFKKQDVDY